MKKCTVKCITLFEGVYCTDITILLHQIYDHTHIQWLLPYIQCVAKSVPFA